MCTYYVVLGILQQEDITPFLFKDTLKTISQGVLRDVSYKHLPFVRQGKYIRGQEDMVY